jgi:TRAP-type transport system periplasmic protein
MKKSIVFTTVALLLVAVLLLGACGTSTSTTSKATTTATTTSTSTQTTTSTTTTPVSGKVYELKFSYHTPPQASMVKAYFQPWTDAIQVASNSQIKITHYGGESLVKAKDQYDALVSGLCDIALVDPSETAGRFPRTEFDTLPYIFPDTVVGAKVYWDILQKYVNDTDFKDVVVLGAVVIAPSNYIGNKPAKNIEDFKGNRVRSSARTEGWTIEALGGTPQEVATSDLYTSMERGLIDSAFLSWSLIMSSGIKDVTKYSTECNLFYRAWPIVMNKKSWASLPANLQQLIMDQSGQANSAKYCAANEALAAGAKGGLAGAYKGASKDPIYTLTAEQTAAWKAAVMPVWDKWASDVEAKGLPGKAIIEDVKSAVQKYSAK